MTAAVVCSIAKQIAAVNGELSTLSLIRLAPNAEIISRTLKLTSL